MMITMLPLSAVTAFAEDTSSSPDPEEIVGDFKYAYTVNGGNATITKFLGPVGSANPNFYDIKIPSELGGHPVTGLGEYSFAANPYDGHQGNPLCSKIRSVTIQQSVTSIGDRAFDGCSALTTLSLGEKIKTIGNCAFENCTSLTGVTIPQSVTSIGYYAFEGCTHLNPLTIKGPITSMGNYAFAGSTYLTSLTLCDDIQTIGNFAFVGSTSLKTVTLPKNLTSIGEYAFADCSELKSITIPEKVETIEPDTFNGCSNLESIMLPAGLTSFQDKLTDCPAGNTDGAIYYKNYKAKADALLADNDNNPKIDANGKLRKRNFLYLCKVTFDANGGKTDYPEVPVYKTEKITETIANDLTAIPKPTRTGYNFIGWYTDDNQLFKGDETITKDITLHARWEFDPNALDCHPLTVTGGTVTVKYDGSDVTNTLTVTPGATTGKKTYDVPQGATVTVTLDKNTVLEGKVFDGWSTTGNLSLLTGQDYKAETITFTMNSDAKVSAKYRDAAADHTPDTAVFHPLTVKDGVITSVTVPGKNGADPEDITEIVKKNANEDGSFNVPEGATVSVAFDKDAFADSGLKFGHWDITGLDDPNAYQDKESFAFEMPAKGVTLKAMTQDASIEDDEPNVLGTAAIIGTAAVGTAVLGYQAYSLGAEFAGKLMALPYFPSNRSALAMMLWEDAGKPMPESELLYPDVEQEEQDMDLQHAARWAMENELIPDLNDEGTAPEEMKFYPDNAVSKLDVLNAWQKAQELKNN